jgi:hypothetical protein
MSKAGRFSELLLVLPEGYFEIVALGWAKIIPLVFSFLLSFLVAIDSLTRYIALRLGPIGTSRNAMLY